MKVSELIRTLQSAKAQHGDVTVVYNDQARDDWLDIEELIAEEFGLEKYLVIK
jgi:hypothetical protein